MKVIKTPTKSKDKVLTLDLETEKTHTYQLANGCVSHNTTSCVLGSSSGIHPHHARRYMRRVQANKLEFPLQEFTKHNPSAVEESVWSSNGTDMVITFLCEVPQGSVVKNQLGAVDLLEKVKSTQQNWVEAGTRADIGTKDYVRHNVSNTITVQPDEWEEITNYIYKNRKWFAGISLLPSSGDMDYPQAPFTTVHTPAEIVKMYGDASVFASGLVVDGLAAFDDKLWAACDCALGFGEKLADEMEEPDAPHRPKKNGYTDKQYSSKLVKYAKDLEKHFGAQEEFEKWWIKKDWIRRAEQFAERYFNGDTRQMTYCLKAVTNWKVWCDLNREYKEIDWSQVTEEDAFYQNVDETAGAACAGGACEVQF
jgi:ribonucleoside-diphosphate reductase alpha chain